MNLLIVLLVGFGISFMGQIVLSNSNIASTQLAVQEGFKNAWYFALGASIVEIIYLRLSLTGMDWVMQHKTIFRALGWITVLLFLVLGVMAFFAARKQTDSKKGILLNNKIHRFLLGAGICAVNPVQIPFWVLWSTQLLQNEVILPKFSHYNIFTIGAGMGTLAGMGVYIYGGNWAIQKMKTSNKTLNIIMGIVFFVTAMIQLYRMIYKPWI